MQGNHKSMMRRSLGLTSLFTLFIFISNRIRRARPADRRQVLQLRLLRAEFASANEPSAGSPSAFCSMGSNASSLFRSGLFLCSGDKQSGFNNSQSETQAITNRTSTNTD
jgi:hypothetical protein